MIDDLSSYAVRDFISFTDEVYLRLFERQHEAWWPAHLLLLALGLAAIGFAAFGKSRVVAGLLVVPLLVSGITFHFQLYAELIPVGRIFGWAFVVQAALVLVWGICAGGGGRFELRIPRMTGFAIGLFGLVGYPWLTQGRDGGDTAIEYAGMAPDPTVCLVLGVVLMAARPFWLLVLLPIPMLWAITTGATLHALYQPHPWMLLTVCILTIILGIIGGWWGKRGHERPA